MKKSTFNRSHKQKSSLFGTAIPWTLTAGFCSCDKGQIFFTKGLRVAYEKPCSLISLSKGPALSGSRQVFTQNPVIPALSGNPFLSDPHHSLFPLSFSDCPRQFSIPRKRESIFSLSFCPKSVPFRDGNTLDPHGTDFGQKHLSKLFPGLVFPKKPVAPVKNLFGLPPASLNPVKNFVIPVKTGIQKSLSFLQNLLKSLRSFRIPAQGRNDYSCRGKIPSREKGFVTIPFLLVSIIILFLILSFFRLTFTLVHASVAQYIAYSTSRKLALGGKNKNGFIKADGHYVKLHKKFFNNAFKANSSDCSEGGLDMFTICSTKDGLIGKGDSIGKKSERERDYKSNHPNKTLFYGVGVLFDYNKALRFKIPFLSKNSNISPPEYAIINSFLGREISQDECDDYSNSFFKQRNTFIYSMIKENRNSQILDGFEANKIKINGGDNGC